MFDRAEITATKRWIETVVIDLNLCPFAKREFLNDRVRYKVSQATEPEQLLLQLLEELQTLTHRQDIETSFLIHPHVLLDFYDYNDFLFSANALVLEQHFEGVYQLASFHPNYQFSETEQNDASNYTNRSPYPMLHILREESLTKAIDAHPDVNAIPERNVSLLNQIGSSKLRALLFSCFQQ